MTTAPSPTTQPTFSPTATDVWAITVNGVSHLYREINGRLVRINTPQAKP